MQDDILSPAERRAIAEAIAQQNAIDQEEAGPRAPHGDISYRGVLLSSRWDVLAEYQRMRSIVNRLPDLMRVRLASIWCDSKCTSNYIVAVKPTRYIADLPYTFEEAVIEVQGGHNGILIQTDAPTGDIMLDCNWGEGPEY